MKIDILVSTMNQTENDTLAKKMHLENDYVIINQITKTILPPQDINQLRKHFISCNERGLSKSRNKAIANSKADICVIADDDMHYEKDYNKIIEQAYEEFPKADIIAFFVDNGGNSNYNKKLLRKGRLNMLETMKIASCQISFKRRSLINNNISFDERFGAGSSISMGEENILLFDSIKKGLSVYSYPTKIATLEANNASTWFHGFNEKYFIDLGKIYFRMSPWLCTFLSLQFALRKSSIYKSQMHPLKAIHLMHRGALKMQKENHEN